MRRTDPVAKKGQVILIPMAGLGTRLRRAGYSQPKMLVEVGGRPLLDWSLDGLRAHLSGSKWVFVALREDHRAFPIERIARQLVSPDAVELVILDKPTVGQLATVIAAEDTFKKAGRIVIHNCDTFVSYRASNFLAARGFAGTIPVFESKDPAYSYCESDEDGRISGVVEKGVVRGGLASTGTYVFDDVPGFLEASRKLMRESRPDHELYISMVYHGLIGNGSQFRADRVNHAWPLGTQSELVRFDRHLRRAKRQTDRGIDTPSARAR